MRDPWFSIKWHWGCLVNVYLCIANSHGPISVRCHRFKCYFSSFVQTWRSAYSSCRFNRDNVTKSAALLLANLAVLLFSAAHKSIFRWSVGHSFSSCCVNPRPCKGRGMQPPWVWFFWNDRWNAERISLKFCRSDRTSFEYWYWYTHKTIKKCPICKKM